MFCCRSTPPDVAASPPRSSALSLSRAGRSVADWSDHGRCETTHAVGSSQRAPRPRPLHCHTHTHTLSLKSHDLTVKPGFQPTQRTQRKERKKRNEMTSLLDRTITAASVDGVCRWHAAKLWQTHATKYEIIEFKFDLHHKLYNK